MTETDGGWPDAPRRRPGRVSVPDPHRRRARGVSSPLGYVLTLAITALLVTGLLVAGGNFVADTREQVVRQELEVVGQHVASNVEMADRLVRAGDDPTTVAVNGDLSERVTGSTYRVELVAQPDPYLRLNTTRPEVSVTVTLDNRTDLGASDVGGGDVSAVYDDAEDEVVIRSG
jgi:hypothetical protein